jgi:hypothetical protein
VDSNQREIDEALRALGWLVWPTHQLGKGFPDRLIAKAGRLVLLEVKDGAKCPSARKLTEDERRARERFNAAGVEILLVMCVADLAQLLAAQSDVLERVSLEP